MTRVKRFLQLEDGWLVPLSLLVLVLLPVFSLNDAQWVDRTQELIPVAIISAFIGLALGKSRLSRFIAAPLGLVLVLGVLYVWFGQLLPPIGVIQYRLWVFPQWLNLYLGNQPVGMNPLWAIMQEIADRNSLMAGSLYDWIVVGTEGGYSSDNFVFFFLLALLAGVVAFYTAWVLYRYRNAIIAVLPVGVALVVNSFLSTRGLTWIIVYVVTTMIVLMAANLATLQRLWQKKDIDYSTELNFDLTMFTVQVSAVLAIVALLMPSLKANPVASTWWIYASRPWGEVETLVNRLFSGVNNPNPDLGTGSKGALVLGGSFDRGEASPVYMYIHTSDYIIPPSEAEALGEPDLGGAPQRYWRGETWDYYTGRGWDHSDKVALDRTASEPVIEYSIPGALTVTQDVEIVAPRADILYAANQPLAVNQAYRYMALGPGDFSSLYLKRAPLSAVKYQVTSTIPLLGVEDLRQAPTDYPEWVKQYYLQLPKSLPTRVTELAKQITAGAVTPYDKAIAIQNYLRELPYDPKIKIPNGTFDAVEYFLFIQKGYCDYFGTVMAVMLRAVDVPARLATGYLPGIYDYGKEHYQVFEKDGHAWTEVYFPPYGWIEFEPTPGQPPISRPSGSLLSNTPFVMPDIPTTVVRTSWLSRLQLPFDLSFLRAVPVLIGLLLIVGLLWSLWPILERRLATSAFVISIYGRMCRYAAWAGLVKPLAATPYEYARSLGDAVSHAQTSTLRWRRPVSTSTTSPAEHISAISTAYVEARYSPHPVTAETRQRVITAWQSVKGRIWSLVAAGVVNRLLRRRK